jgi:tetratricopeptide (TPR) repeat protein
MDTDNVVDLELALKKMNSKRKLASSDPKMGKSALSYVSLMTGRAYRETKNFVASEEALKKISEPKLSRIKLKELMMTYSESGRFEKVVPLGLKALEKDGSPENKDCLVMMRNAVVEGKQWSSADSVLKAATKNQIKEKELAPFLSMAGRADLERGNCSVSIKHYEEALKLNPEAKDKAESRFYLGKCFFRMKDNKSALKEWQEVASLKDEFWSPLAESEIKLVESP